jgi:Cu+-exporting ATPase
MLGVGIAVKKGIYIRRAEAFGLKVDTVVFGKTGTISAGKPMISNYIGIGSFPKEAVLQYSAIAEKRSDNPIGKSIVALAHKEKMSVNEPVSFVKHAGGVEAVHNNKKILLGNKLFFSGQDIVDADEMIAYYEKQGKTVLILTVDRKVAGVLALSDGMKEGCLETIKALHLMGKKIILMTSDHKRTAEAIAKELGIEEVIADMKSEEKEEYIRQLQKKGHVIAFVGDGVRDAPLISVANIGISFGEFSDADVVIPSGDIMKVTEFFKISSRTVSKIKQNLILAFGYNSIGILIAAGVLYPVTGWLLSPMIAGGAMVLSIVSVAGNSLMMRK